MKVVSSSKKINSESNANSSSFSSKKKSINKTVHLSDGLKLEVTDAGYNNGSSISGPRQRNIKQ